MYQKGIYLAITGSSHPGTLAALLSNTILVPTTRLALTRRRMKTKGISRQRFLRLAGFCGAGISLGSPLFALKRRNHPKRPNIILFLVDDLGYGDLECYGNDYHETPNIDRLAAEGVRFTSAYGAAPNCSPTRASILTGQWPARTGITNYLPGNRKAKFVQQKPLIPPDLPPGLPLSLHTLAEVFNSAGYATVCAGKWHLGSGRHSPVHHGFDAHYSVEPGRRRRSMFAPYDQKNSKNEERGEYLTDRLTSDALRFIRESENRPFFLYFPFFAVHRPLGAKQALIEKYRTKSEGFDDVNPVFAGMLEGIDVNVGRILSALENLTDERETIILFTADNGGKEKSGSDIGPLRKDKGWLYEGGIRVPLILWGSNTIPRGYEESTPVSSVDFYPTLLSLANINTPNNQPVDGIDLTPLIQRNEPLHRKELYWHFPHYSWAGASPGSAIRSGRYKLIESLETGEVELYDLIRDIGEHNNLAESHAGLADSLRQRLNEWRTRVGARMPKERDLSD